MLFLDQDDAIEGVARGSTVFSCRRIDQALQLRHVGFVTHDSCQEVGSGRWRRQPQSNDANPLSLPATHNYV